MMASRGMGAINPSKMPKGKKMARRDDTDFDQYAEGGEVGGDAGDVADLSTESKLGGGVTLTKRFAKGGESKVNEAGVYTKPGMRKSLFESIKARAVQGTAAGQWSARKAQLLAKKYKAKGGGYKS